MILFFGTRSGKTELTALSNVKCPHCEQAGTLTVSKTNNWFHLFWIKLFKVSTNIIAECSHCKGVYFEAEFSEEMKNKLESVTLD